LPKPAVIVANSLVARGGVGGRAAVFSLERLGFPVWQVPTVLLPWHPGHGPGTRIVPDPGAFRAFVGDLAKSPKLGEVGGMLTGYVADATEVATIAVLVQALNRANPNALYLCDPVLGDGGRLYIPEPAAVAIRDKLVPLAEMLTPNRFELGFLTGRELADNDALADAARSLGVAEVVVTSGFASHGEVANILVTAAEAWLATHPAVSNPPHGTGDLLAALYLGYRLADRAPSDAFEQAVSVTYRLIDMAAVSHADALPLASGQDALLAAPAGVTVVRL
jgi:pyridoxine kinase